jgi:hypothetical protein
MKTGEAPKEANDFDAAAKVAAIELAKLDKRAVMVVANWQFAHYMKAGHKRLGRLLVDIARQEKHKQSAKE